MKLCIVGHGPSLKGRVLGSKIDSHDIVVRLKGGAKLLGTDDYGSRIDHLCASTEILGAFFKVQVGSFWGYPKNGNYNFDKGIKAIMDLGPQMMIPSNLCNHWNEIFRKMGGRHPNVSTGTAAIIISAHYYEPPEIVLAGFDTLLNPTIAFTRNDEIPRSGSGRIDHDWYAEHQLLKKIREVYGCEIKSL